MAERLNVVLVVLEGARADHLSCYGYARETTPFLDQVAREGVRFTNMIVSAPGPLPAQATLFTGKYAATHAATEEMPFLTARHQTLAEVLSAAGYRTAAFCTNPWVSPETGLGRGFAAFFTQRYHNRLAARAVQYGRRAADRLLRRKDGGARRTTAAVKRWIAAGSGPVFAFVHHTESALPFTAPPPFSRMFLPRGISAERLRAVAHAGQPPGAAVAAVTAEDAAIAAALYDGALRYVDSRLRELADFLQARGEWERTLLVVTADHGELLGEPVGTFADGRRFLGHEGSLADPVVRVPLILRCPPRVPRGFVVDEIAQTIDIRPTIENIVGVEEHSGPLPGRPLLEDGHATRGPAFAIVERFRPSLTQRTEQSPGGEPRAGDVRMKAIRSRRDKFVWHSDEANELYDLVADAAEQHNSVESGAARADALRRQLFDWLASVERAEIEPEAGSEEPAAGSRKQDASGARAVARIGRLINRV
jgi:arylsulfatase A-like enzyme